MKVIIEQYILILLLILIIWVGSSLITENVQYGRAQTFLLGAIEEIENSSFNQNTIRKWQEYAKKRKYALEVKRYGNNQCKLTLQYVYRIPLIRKTKQYKLEQYSS